MDRSPLAGEVVRYRDGGPRCVAAIKRQRGPRSSLGAGGSRAMRPRSPRRRSLHTAAHVARSTSVRTAQHSTPWAQHARPQPTRTARHGTPDHCAACSRARAARCTSDMNLPWLHHIRFHVVHTVYIHSDGTLASQPALAAAPLCRMPWIAQPRESSRARELRHTEVWMHGVIRSAAPVRAHVYAAARAERSPCRGAFESNLAAITTRVVLRRARN